MCGILGTINIQFGHELLDTIKHRGPDGFGLTEFKDGENVLKLAHRRLSIIDLSDAGHQPMLTDCKDYALIFNGEIYNHEQLRKQLPEGILFKGHSDTETILYYLKEFGIQGIRSLNGIFGLAFFDRRNGILYLARDRYGVKPLYYYHSGNKMIFSSEIRPLKKTFRTSIDFSSLANVLRQRYSPAPFTIYQEISKLQPGEIVTIDLKSPTLAITTTSFIDSPSSKLGSRKGDVRGLVNLYGDLFEKAVERQLLADVEVGILLSGGIDSALVAAIASRKLKNKAKTFTVGYNGDSPELDEINYAQETAQLLGLAHFTTCVNQHSFLDSIKKATSILEEPLGTTSIVPMYFLAELAASHVKVVLSGQGADEPLGGYAKYKALEILEKFRALKSFFLPTMKVRFNKVENDKARRFLTALMAMDDTDAFIEFNAVTSFAQIKALFQPAIGSLGLTSLMKNEERFKTILRNKADVGNNIRNLFPFYDLRTSLPDDMLLYADKLTMNFGLECRVPMLDNDLVEFLESLKTGYKFNMWDGKIIHKRFAREYLPSSIINRKKLAFKSPAKLWFRENKESLMEEFKQGSEFVNIFNLNTINQILTAHSQRNNLENLIFLLLSLRYFLEGERQHSATISNQEVVCPQVA